MLIKVQEQINMKFALFIVELPAFSPEKEETEKGLWREFLQKVKSVSDSNEEIEILGENVLWLHLNMKLSTLLKVCAVCREASHPYKVLFFDEEPTWVTS